MLWPRRNPGVTNTSIGPHPSRWPGLFHFALLALLSETTVTPLHLDPRSGGINRFTVLTLITANHATGLRRRFDCRVIGRSVCRHATPGKRRSVLN
jgi:hypothetical protein